MPDYTPQQVEALTAAISRLADAKEDTKATLLNTRAPSRAREFGQGPRRDTPTMAGEPHPFLKGSLDTGAYVPGSFLTAVWQARSRDAQEQAEGKAALAVLGLEYLEAPMKATLGNTDAAGGYVLPNNLVDTVVKPAVAEAVYAAGANPLLTVRTGVNVRGVDLPYRTGAPARMTFQDWGATKENVDEVYGSYSATLGTIARIYDLGKQYLRFSAGAAEQDVMDELTKARDLAENYYTIAGAGTGTGSSGDPSVGIYTALTDAGISADYTTAFSGASSSTVAGSAAAAIAAARKALAKRSRRPTALVTDAETYFTILSQGSDNAGFWMAELLGAGFHLGDDGQLLWRGIPLLWDPNFDANTGTTKAAILADWKAFKFYRGMEFRIDTSDQAGDRWDKNLVGFRGEEEIGLNARPAVYTGAAQLIPGIIP